MLGTWVLPDFRNLFMYSPTAKRWYPEHSVVRNGGKDKFMNIKNLSRDDTMAAHRVPLQMLGIIPNNTGGFGDVEKASRVFVHNERITLQKRP